MAKRKTVRLGDIKPAPIRHETLPDELLTRLRAIWEQFAGHSHVATLEEFERGFMRDMNPDREVAVWEIIARAFSIYREQFPETGTEKLKKVYGWLVGLSMGAKPDASRPELERLNACYKEASTGQ